MDAYLNDDLRAVKTSKNDWGVFAKVFNNGEELRLEIGMDCNLECGCWITQQQAQELIAAITEHLESRAVPAAALGDAK